MLVKNEKSTLQCKLDFIDNIDYRLIHTVFIYSLFMQGNPNNLSLPYLLFIYFNQDVSPMNLTQRL